MKSHRGKRSLVAHAESINKPDLTTSDKHNATTVFTVTQSTFQEVMTVSQEPAEPLKHN